MNPLDNLKDEMSTKIYGISKSEAIRKGICVSCKRLASERCHSEAGRKEYFISGLCEVCWDELFKNPE